MIPGAVGVADVLPALPPDGAAVEVVPVEFVVTVVLLLLVLLPPPQPAQNKTTISKVRTPKALRIFSSPVADG